VVTKQVPPFVSDFIGQAVVPGDRIVMTINIGKKGLEIGSVLGFQYGKRENLAGEVLKVKVLKDNKTKPSFIEAELKRFVRVPNHF
jgi:hypothetical protein